MRETRATRTRTRSRGASQENRSQSRHDPSTSISSRPSRTATRRTKEDPVPAPAPAARSRSSRSANKAKEPEESVSVAKSKPPTTTTTRGRGRKEQVDEPNDVPKPSRTRGSQRLSDPKPNEPKEPIPGPSRPRGRGRQRTSAATSAPKEPEPGPSRPIRARRRLSARQGQESSPAPAPKTTATAGASKPPIPKKAPPKTKEVSVKLVRCRTTTTTAPRPDPAPTALSSPPVNDENDPPPFIGEINRHLYLPPRSLFPTTEQSHSQRAQILNNELRAEVLKIVARMLKNVQEEGSLFVENYDKMERLYEYVDDVVPDDLDLGNKYRQMVVSVLWQLGAVVWKQVGTGSHINPFMDRVAAFLSGSLLRLGWNQDRQWRKKSTKWKWKMEHWKKERLVPAAYHTIKQFYRTHSDTSISCRVNQLNLILEIATAAHSSNNNALLEHMFKTIFTCIQIRLKDKSTAVRAIAISILAKFIDIEGAEDAVLKQLKFFTRYDPSIEVRRIGTNTIGRNDRTRIRFFFDQAFDKNPSVRAEAYRVLGMMKKDEDNMLRDMHHLQPEKLCKLITWGLNYSDSKCSSLLKNEVLPNWLKYSCGNSLIKFLSNLDAYANMKAVLKILDIMLTTDEQMRFVEDLDFSFITDLKMNIVKKRYANVTIEAMVAWLSLCKASEKIESIRARVVPTGEDMILVIQCLHECAFLEHDKSQIEDRIEDVSPIICTVVALQITKFVTWEEGGRRTLQTLLKNMLLDPVMDERVLIMQAMYKLYDHVVDKQDFEDIMMSVFQDVFDSRNSFHRMTSIAHRRRSSLLDRSVEMQRNPALNTTKEEINFVMQVKDQDQEDAEPEVGRAAEEQESMVEKVEEDVDARPPVEDAPVPPTAPPVEEEPVRMTSYQLTKLREKLCDLALNRYNLTRKRDALIAEKKFIDAIPLNDEIMRIQVEENENSKLLKFQEELAKRPPPPPPQPPQPSPQVVKTPAPSPSAAAAAVNEQEFERMEEDEEELDEDEEMREESGVIDSVEQGLAKGIFMINTYLDLMPDRGLHAFFRNFYENYAPQFMMEHDVTIRQAIFQFLTRVAMSDKRELKKVTNMLVLLLLGDCECEIKNVAFKGVVDLILRYQYEDFVISQEERERDDAVTMALKRDFTNHLKLVVNQHLTYETATATDISKMLLDILTRRFPPSSQQLSNQERALLNTTKNQGLLKLLVAGNIREPSQLARVLMLWVNHDYSGTPVLRDLENVLNLYNTFEWWGSGPGNVLEDDDEEDREYAVERYRVLGLAIAEATVYLCQEGRGVDSEAVNKFVGYMVTFLDHRDQSLMRAMSSTILSPVLSNPTRSFNTTLVRAATHVPMTTLASAKRMAITIDLMYKAMRDHPPTQSLTALKKEVSHFVARLKRVHGEEALVVEGLNGKTRIVGTDFVWGDEPYLDGNGSFSSVEENHVEVFSESDTPDEEN